MSISQKILSYIPFVNIMIIPMLWFRFYLKTPTPKGSFIKCILKRFSFGVLITVPRIIISKVFGNGLIDVTSTYIGIILTMFIICFTMVNDEKKHITKN